jgi:hypothetical protein
MDTTLVTVTLLSMGMAGALSVIVWRMLREDRQRSDARVAALASLADNHERVDRILSTPPERARRVEVARPEPIPRVEARPAPPPRVPAASRDQHDDFDLPIVADAPDEPAGMFVEHHEESPWRGRLVVMAALGLVVASVVLFSLAAHEGRATRPVPRTVPTAAAQPAQAAQPAAPQAGLELVSLRDARQPAGAKGKPGAAADTLTITGLVRNPRTGTLLSRVTVTAYAFDENGAFLASGRALIDVTSLAPGDDSPFVVSVPSAGKIARYRIGFRGEDGRVIAHVDKRQQGPVAANW